MFVDWLAAFFVTQAVEVPIYAHALRHRGGSRFALASLASLVTHPIVFFVSPAWIPSSYVAGDIVAEAFAVAAEAVYFRALGVSKPVSVAVVANLTSTALGLALRALFNWP